MKNRIEEKYLVNNQIKSNEIIVITSKGDNLGVIQRDEALAKASEEELDLVQVGIKDGFPVTKIMDFGKFLYTKKKHIADTKKHQKIIQLKEIKIRPNIDDQDYKTKVKKAAEFFRDGNRVKFTLQFKGREITMLQTLGQKLFDRLIKDLQDQQLGTLVEEKDSKIGSSWFKIYFIKPTK